jgi:cell division protein ZapD
MLSDPIIFQFAMQYLPKKALHLECLFKTIQTSCAVIHPVIHHYALNNILSMIKLCEKPELKGRFLKELIRIDHVLHKSNTTIPDSLYAKLFVQIQVLSHLAGRFGGDIHNNNFLQSLQFTQINRHGEGELYPPQLLLWLENSASQRQNDLIIWSKQLQPLSDTINIYLSILREISPFERIKLVHGYYQGPLHAHLTPQLVSIRLEKAYAIVPNIQFGHHGLTLRLTDAHSMREVHQGEIDVDLAICQL